MWRIAVAALVGLAGAFLLALFDVRQEWNYFLVLVAFGGLCLLMLMVIGDETMDRLADARRRRAHRR